MVFDTELFITEIKNRPCIWNVNAEEYNNKSARYAAWTDIAKTLYPEYNTLEQDSKLKKLQILQKRWKGLRDYYNREKNKDIHGGKLGRKKRKTPYLDMLRFLFKTTDYITVEDPATNNQTTKKTNSLITSRSNERTNNETINQAGLTPFKTSSEDRQITPFQEALLKAIDKRHDDPDMNFLLNILPDMKSMTPKQNFDFRFEVMKVIKDIKYKDGCQPAAEPSTSVVNAAVPSGYLCQYEFSDIVKQEIAHSDNSEGPFEVKQANG